VACDAERNTSKASVPAYLPLFSIVIAISAFSAVLGSYFYRRRDSTDDVEEANFEFYHMTIQGMNYRLQDPVTIKMVARKAKRAWGFWRARAQCKMKNVLWHSAPVYDENEMQDVTECLLPGMRSYNTSGVIITDS